MSLLTTILFYDIKLITKSVNLLKIGGRGDIIIYMKTGRGNA